MTASALRDAFVAGYAPPAAGPYFNGLELLAEASRGADISLAKQIGTERDLVVQKRDAALARLDYVEMLVAALGVDAIARPIDAGGYAAWAEAVFEAVNAALEPGSAESVAHLLGYVMGEAMATLDALAIVARLRPYAPEHLWLRLQRDSLEHERTTAERRLGRLAAHPLLPEPVQTATAMAAHHTADRSLLHDDAARAVAEQAAMIEAML